MSASGSLFVATAGNNRVLRFGNAANLLNNQPNASAVLGQIDFTGTSSGTSATQMSSPSGVFITPEDSLFVSDSNNNRVLRFDAASTAPSGTAAKAVIGQPGFTSNTPTTTSTGLRSPAVQPFVDTDGSLWVPDYNNNRVLRFPADATKPLLAVTSTVPKTTSTASITIKGTASDAYGVSVVQYKVNNGAVKTAAGTTSWQFKATLAKGSNTITIFATDNANNVSLSKVINVQRKSSAKKLSPLAAN